MKNLWKNTVIVVIVTIMNQVVYAKPLEGDALRNNIVKRLPSLNHAKMEALMHRVGKKVPKNFYDCLCSGHGGVGGHSNYGKGGCEATGVLGGHWTFAIPKDGGTWGYCINRVKYDDNSTIVDKIIAKIEGAENKKKKLDNYCIKINKIPSSGIMKGAVTQELFKLPDAENIPVREGTYDIHGNKLPDYWNAWWDRFSKRTGELWQNGYPKPVKTNLTNYNSWTLEYLEQNVCQISDPCKQAIFIKLFLDASQDDFVPVDFFNTPKEKFAEVGLDIMLTIYIPNWFDKAKWGKDTLINWKNGFPDTVPSEGTSELKVMSALWNMAAIAKSLRKIATGTHGGQVGRWKFAIYRQALKKGWTPEQIEQERRRRLEQNDSLLKEINALKSEMVQKVLLREAQHKKRLKEIEKTLVSDMQKIDADEAVDGETRRRSEQLKDPNFVVPGTEFYRRGEVIADRVKLEEKRQRYLADAKNHYDRARFAAKAEFASMKAAELVDRERDIRMIGKTYNEKISEYLGRMAKISAENDVLKRYATPVSAGECEKLRSTPADGHK